MTSRLALIVLLVLCAPSLPGGRPAAAPLQEAGDDQRIRAMLQRLQQAAQRADPEAYLAVLTAQADRRSATTFATQEFRPGAAKVVVLERNREDLPGTLPGNGYALTVDAFMQFADRARVVTWGIDCKRVGDEWLIADQLVISAVENLYHFTLNPTKQFDARNFTIRAEDFTLTLAEGAVFTVDSDLGTTGLVLTGRGDLRFAPAPASEKEQLKIFSGGDVLETRFEAAYVRVGTLGDHADMSALVPRPVEPREFRRAEQIFREESAKSFIVDLTDFSKDTWSLPAGADDFIAEVRTRRFETLTYAHASAEAEDISFFERRRHRNIAVYASAEKLASRGRFYNEDELAAYDVLDYDIEVAFQPERQWIDGKASMHLRTRAPLVNQLNIRLADALAVRSVTSDQFGRLFNLRVANQNTLLVNLPAGLLRDSEITVTIAYAGRLEPQAPEREALAPQNPRDPGAPQEPFEDPFVIRPESSYLYSNSAYWYPQSTISDYAVAKIQLTIPVTFGCVASGRLLDTAEVIPARDQVPARKVYQFLAERPVRYLSFLVSRFQRVGRATIGFPPSAPLEFNRDADGTISDASFDAIELAIDANPRQTGRGRGMSDELRDVVQFYQSLIGDAPYPTFTLAVIENDLPGGHSPGYFAVLNQTLPTAQVTWRNDPAAFTGFPEFFLAHEVAHQWWGQAIGWRNYHEQWLSEGFAQYFAALYAEHARGDDTFDSVMRQLRRWAIDQSAQGPIYLGYRVGHVKNDGRAFRAVVYNKGAAVLHMLRRLLGDEHFFNGIRRFYAGARYTKVGSDDFRRALEAESGRPLERFFERWVYSSALPRLTFSYRVERQEAVLHFEQTGDIFDIPITLTLQYADRKPGTVVVPVTDRVVDIRIPLEGLLRAIDLDRDDGTLAEVTRNQ